MKLDRLELIRLIEARPREGFFKSKKEGDWLLIFLGSLFVVTILFAIGTKSTSLLFGSPPEKLVILIVFLIFGGCMLGLGVFNLLQRKRYLVLKEKYWAEINPGDLVEALHFTGKWRSGMAIAEEKFLPEKDRDFGLVWLACQCGNRRFADCYRVLLEMEDREIVLHHMRQAENRAKKYAVTFGLWYIPYVILSNGGKWITPLIWHNPLVAAANVWIVDSVLVLFIVIWISAMIWRFYRLGSEEFEALPYLKRLGREKLDVLVGWGRLGRIASVALRG